MASYGYARVSSLDQDLTIQRAALKAAGCGVIRAEKASGSRLDGRTELQVLLLGLSTDAPAEAARLTERLDAAYRSTAANLPKNAAVHVGGAELVYPPSTSLKNCSAWSRSKAPSQPASHGWTCPNSCWRCTPD